MYTSPTIGPNTGFCFRVANATHELGCAGWTGSLGLPMVAAAGLAAALDGPLQGQQVVVLSSVEELPALLAGLSGDQPPARVRAVLVTNHTAAGKGRPLAFSGAPAFPSPAYAPYEAQGYIWNPSGKGFSLQRFEFPVVLLDGATTVDAVRRVEANAALGFAGGPLHVAEVDGTMMARGTSAQCIEQSTCRPLGGHTVWAALPPLPLQPSETAMPEGLLRQGPRNVVLVTAQADTDSFFKYMAQGAGSPMSGLAAMLVAAHTLGRAGLAAGYSKHLVFMALAGDTTFVATSASPASGAFAWHSSYLHPSSSPDGLLCMAGEPWDYMGSRKLLWDLSHGDGSVQPLARHSITEVVELGSLGRAAGGVFVHRQRDGRHGDASELSGAFLAAAEGLGMLGVREASADNPGVPPSSLMSFLKYNNTVKGVVLADHDGTFASPYFRSHLDGVEPSLFGNASEFNASAVAAAGVLAARALHAIAGGAEELPVNTTWARELAEELEECLLRAEPGFACPLALSLMSSQATYNPLPHYVGVLYRTTEDPQDPQPSVKSNKERFLWNLLAQYTGSNTTTRCEPDFKYYKPFAVCGAGQVCVGWHHGQKELADRQGWCFDATVKFVPSHSTRLTCEGCDVTRNGGGVGRWRLNPDNAMWREKHGGWPEDPVWAESNWQADTPRILIYLREQAGTQYAVLVAGCAVTAATLLAVWLGGRVFERHAKRQ